MSFTIATGDVFEVRVYTEGNNQLAVNTIHVKVTSVSIVTTTEQQAADGFSRFWCPKVAGVVDENVFVQGVITRRLTPTKTKGRQSTVGATVGTRPGELMPGQVTALIKLITDDPGAGKDGKIYIPFVSETDSDVQGAITAGYITALEGFAGFMDASGNYLNGAGGTMFAGAPVIFRRSSSANSLITGTVVKRQWATQHRRSFAGKGDSNPF